MTLSVLYANLLTHEGWWWSEEVMDTLELELDHCEVSCRCWEPNPGSLEEQQVLLDTEPSLYPSNVYFVWPGTQSWMAQRPRKEQTQLEP